MPRTVEPNWAKRGEVARLIRQGFSYLEINRRVGCGVKLFTAVKRGELPVRPDDAVRSAPGGRRCPICRGKSVEFFGPRCRACWMREQIEHLAASREATTTPQTTRSV